MPKTELQQAERVLGQVSHLLSRFESVRGQDAGAAGGVSLREVQKLTARIDSQFAHITNILNGFSRAQKLFGNDVPTIGAENFGSNVASGAASDNAPRRSQDEISHLFSRFIAGGFDNF